MRIIRDYHHCPESARGAVIALGNFDGLHRGHMAVLEETQRIAAERNAPAAVMTFHPHPREFFANIASRAATPPTPRAFPSPQPSPLGEEGGNTPASLTLMPLPLKACMLDRMGVQTLFAQRFNRALSSLTAEAFVRQVLGEHLKVSHVVTGEDFIFGHKRGGNAALLEAMGGDVGFGTTRVVAQMESGERFSSTRIRALLAEGHIRGATRLLGRPHLIMGRVQKGDQRGRKLGFPTANLRLRGMFLPAFGVYAARVGILPVKREAPAYASTFRFPGPNDGFNGWHDGVANLGLRPMYGAAEPLLEAHIFHAHGHTANPARDFNVYGEKLVVALVERLRPEAVFDSEAQLMAQMEQDAKAARALLEKEPPMNPPP